MWEWGTRGESQVGTDRQQGTQREVPRADGCTALQLSNGHRRMPPSEIPPLPGRLRLSFPPSFLP